MKRIKNALLAIMVYIIIIVLYKPTTFAESTGKKLQSQNIICIMRIYNITDDTITFEDKSGNLWCCFGDLKYEYKGQYVLVVLQHLKGQDFNSTKVIDYILKDDIRYMTRKRIMDVLNL
jgi:hypothetical protein